MNRRTLSCILGSILLAHCATGCGPTLLDLIEPATERLEPAVRSQLSESLARVRAQHANRQELGRAYGELGRLYHSYGLLDSAIPAYANAETLLPGERAWPYYLGRVYRSLYDMERARLSLERARRMRPDDAPTLVALAGVQRELRQFDEAVRLLQDVLGRNPDSAAAMLLMATLATDRGDSNEAVEWYERLLALQPGATRLYQPLAMAYRNLGQTDHAEELLSKAGTAAVRIDDPLMLELESLGLGARRLLDEGVAAFQRGDFDAALVAFRGAVVAQPQNVGAHLNFGSALVKTRLCVGLNL